MGGKRRNVYLVEPRDTIRELKARKKKGETVSASALRNTGLYDRAIRDFGSWTAALKAAGIKPTNRGRPPEKKAPSKAKLVPLTPKLLASKLSNKELARRTGLDRKTIRTHRANMNGGALPGRGELLGRLQAIVDRKGRRAVEKALHALDPRAGSIVLRRALSDPPVPLHRVAADLGLSVNRVGLIERKALQDLLAKMRR